MNTPTPYSSEAPARRREVRITSTAEPMTDCGGPVAIYRVEGYGPRDGRLHGSLDVALYACAEHERCAREVVSASGLTPYTCQTIGTGHTMRCGDSWCYDTSEPPGRWSS